MTSLPTQQYELVKSARGALLAYCATLTPAHFGEPLAQFDGSGIRQLLVHVAGTYHFWLGTFALRHQPPAFAAEHAYDLAQVRQLYDDVNMLVEEFTRHFHGRWDDTVTGPVANRVTLVSTTPLELLLHVITHEFHHKGQVLSMSRQLGYQPADTDIIRFP
ncbi:DinB family protein [Hymenobacter crusticola]|uniref:Damage-inducible protein DinB n=1 Tax=Hymenobacter crusticola TaxID=1770526 RepID=A0A243W977_9BACT|nr:DinB family protein [Hymenobacter crusticola]OUJ71965.1 hypothetical protein BXP70_20335 [Hymenobacter crusticola]